MGQLGIDLLEWHSVELGRPKLTVDPTQHDPLPSVVAIAGNGFLSRSTPPKFPFTRTIRPTEACSSVIAVTSLDPPRGRGSEQAISVRVDGEESVRERLRIQIIAPRAILNIPRLIACRATHDSPGHPHPVCEELRAAKIPLIQASGVSPDRLEIETPDTEEIGDACLVHQHNAEWAFSRDSYLFHVGYLHDHDSTTSTQVVKYI